MSLRARILVAIVLVNLAVTALLAGFLAVDLENKDKDSRQRQEEAISDYKRSILNIFGQSLGGPRGALALEVEDPANTPLHVLYRRMLRHPIRYFIEDGVIQRCVILENVYTTTLRGRLVPQGSHLNLGGCKGRITVDDELVQERILRAIESDSRLEEWDEGGGWMAAPIRLRAISTDGPGIHEEEATEEKPWGGVFFQARRPPQRDWEPTFGSSLYWVMGLGTVLLVGLTWLLMDRWVLRPLNALTRGATRVARRDYDQPVSGDGSDELGRLVASFNSMMLQVRGFEESLTQRVDEATRREEQSRRGLVIAQRLAATGTLASGIAHEINNPLGGLRNATARLRRDAESGRSDLDVQRRYLKLLDDGLSRMQEIVRRVLTFSPRRVDPCEVSVRELVRKAIDLAEHRADKNEVELRLEGEDARIIAEPGEVQQVVLNLLLNAVDASSRPGQSVIVQIDGQLGDKVRIVVDDEGPGVPLEERERIFDLFYSTKEVGKGTGLGLSVAHHIVEQHGGSLQVESAPGGGARFVILLPRAPRT